MRFFKRLIDVFTVISLTLTRERGHSGIQVKTGLRL